MIKNMTKEQLADSLKKLMLSKPFEKITIKQICDETGVIRITFYNYFVDKYEALEYIIYRDILLSTLPYIKQGKLKDALLVLFYAINQNKVFYHEGLHHENLPQFKEYVVKSLNEMMRLMLACNRDLSDDVRLQEFHAMTLLFVITYQVDEVRDLSQQELMDLISHLMERGFTFLKV